MNMFRFKKTQRVRVIMGTVSFYTTAHQIRSGVGDFLQCNAALQKALESVEYTRSCPGAAEKSTVGIAGTWEGLAVQLNIV